VDLSVGFTVDDPPVTLKWGAAEAEIQKLIGTKLRQVTAGYWTMTIVALGGLRCRLGLHFDRKGKGLQELEFFGNECPDLKASFDEFQRYFEAAFGAPTRTRRGAEGFPDHTWLIGRREIFHVVRERFGPEEHMRIRPLDFGQRIRRWLGERPWVTSAAVLLCEDCHKVVD
jgi:hypothetical protein